MPTALDASSLDSFKPPSHSMQPSQEGDEFMKQLKQHQEQAQQTMQQASQPQNTDEHRTAQ